MPAPPFAISPPRTTVSINQRFAVSIEGELRVVFLEGQPVMEFHQADTAARDLVIVNMCEHGGLTQAEVARAFGVSRATVSRAQKGYDQGGVQALVAEKRGPKSPTKIKDEKQKLMIAMARKGLRKTEIAARLGVNESAVRKALRRLGLEELAVRQPKLGIEAVAQAAIAETAAVGPAAVLEQEAAPAAGRDSAATALPEPAVLQQWATRQQTTAPQTREAEEPQANSPATASAEGKTVAETDVHASPSVELPAVTSFDSDPEDRSLDRAFARMGLLDDAAPLFATRQNVRSAGLLLAIPILVMHAVFADAVKAFGNIGPAFYGIRNVVASLLLMFVARINRPEHLKEHSPRQLGCVLGLDRAPEMKTLRRKIRQLSNLNKSVEFMQLLTNRHLGRKQETQLWMYMDGHVSVYSGKRKLAEHYATRLRLALPSVLDYWVNDEQGDPIMVISGAPKKAMVKLLPRLIQDLRDQGERRLITLIFDREGWSPKMFAQLSAMENVQFLTYRKAPPNKKLPRLPLACFSTHKREVDGQQVEYELADTMVNIDYGGGKWLRLRQITRRRENGDQTHILTNDLTTDAVLLAHRMFGRWGQENFFKYMTQEQDFDGLLTYAMEDADGDREVANPKRRKLAKKIRTIQQQLQSLTQEYGARALENQEERRSTMRGFKIANGPLGQQIRTLTAEVDRLQQHYNSLPAKVPVRQTLKGKKPQQILIETRRLISCFRIAVFRAESALRELLRPHYRQWRQDGRTIIQSMLQSSGDLEVHEDELRVILAPQSAPHRTKALAQLCEELNALDTRFPGSNLRLKFSAREPAVVS